MFGLIKKNVYQIKKLGHLLIHLIILLIHLITQIVHPQVIKNAIFNLLLLIYILMNRVKNYATIHLRLI